MERGLQMGLQMKAYERFADPTAVALGNCGLGACTRLAARCRACARHTSGAHADLAPSKRQSAGRMAHTSQSARGCTACLHPGALDAAAPSKALALACRCCPPPHPHIIHTCT